MTATALSKAEEKTLTAIGSPAGIGDQATFGQPAPADYVSWEDFEENYLTREDLFKYEWSDGRVIKTPRTMGQYQYFIVINLMKRFNQLMAEGKVSGHLLSEIDTKFLPKHHRRPDMAWFTDEQAARMAYRQNQVPRFVIEIISDNDKADDLLDKLEDYENAQVEVIWLISPALKQVRVINGSSQAACIGEAICSAAPVLPNFKISANDLFKKPELPA